MRENDKPAPVADGGELPACPLCRERLHTFEPKDDGDRDLWWCPEWKADGSRSSCELRGAMYSPEAWRKLAAPALHDVAALRARADAAEWEVERLRTGHPPDEAEARTRKELQDLLRDMGEVAATQTARADAAEREVERLRHHLKLVEEAWEADKESAKWAQTCGCMVDKVTNVCMVHSPAVAREKARADRLAEALREISQSTLLQFRDIAAAALAGEENHE